jgi:hypothetical protein
MKVLVACEFSGIVRDAFKARGHDAWSCDILPTDSEGNHIQGDVLEVLDQGWDLMIAHPPCTWLCAAMRTNAARKDRPQISSKFVAERKKGYDFVMALYNAPIPKICLENPIGYLNGAWRKPDQIIRPFMFGHPYRKDICLWLKNLPKLMPTHEQEDNLFYPVENGRKKLDFWSKDRNPNGRSLKSITFEGIAKAMADQWG